jgi:hypothetical protein
MSISPISLSEDWYTFRCFYLRLRCSNRRSRLYDAVVSGAHFLPSRHRAGRNPLTIRLGYSATIQPLNPKIDGQDMDQPRRLLSRLTSLELSRRAIEYRRMAITAHGQTIKLALDKLAIRFALLAAKRILVPHRPRSLATIHSVGSTPDRPRYLSGNHPLRQPHSIVRRMVGHQIVIESIEVDWAG